MHAGSNIRTATTTDSGFTAYPTFKKIYTQLPWSSMGWPPGTLTTPSTGHHFCYGPYSAPPASGIIGTRAMSGLRGPIGTQAVSGQRTLRAIAST